MIKRLIQRFGEKVTRKSCIPGGAKVVFEELMADKGFKNVVEIGTGQGISAVIMAQFANHVYTFDIKHPEQNIWGFLKCNNITLTIGDAEKYQKLNTLEFDFAFIDGNHEGDFPMMDFEAVKKCGRVLFHDIKRPAVKKVLDALDVTIINDMAYWRNL